MKAKKHSVDYTWWVQLSQSEKLDRIYAGSPTHNTDFYVHKKVAQYLRTMYPEVRFYSTLDGLNWGTQRSIISALRWYNEHEEGTGVPDLFIYKRNRKYTMLVIELKKEGGKKYGTKHLKNQQGWLDYLNSIGAKAEFAVGFDEAEKLIKEYMRLS